MLPWRQTRVFKQAKKALGLQSRRDGFGRDGMWYWSLPIQPSDSALQTRVDVLAKDAAALADEAVYGEAIPDQPGIPVPARGLATTRPGRTSRWV